MPEFLTLMPPDTARARLLAAVHPLHKPAELIPLEAAVGRVLAQDLLAPHALPNFPRSTVDGYAVRARDTYGASDTLPGYLTLIGEVPMGATPGIQVQAGQCALIHTGGMLPNGADAVLMLEYTQTSRPGEIELQRSVANGENIIAIGEDVSAGQLVLPAGKRLRPADIGGLAALGITSIPVHPAIRVGILSSGDEVVPASAQPTPGQVRDINSHTLAALVSLRGAIAVQYGIISDDHASLLASARRALSECDVVLITAGSSASTRDMTAAVIGELGQPGVLVHGINTRPGKPTILGTIDGKAVIGLPGNPVSALVNGYLFVLPLLQHLHGIAHTAAPCVRARLTVNLASQAGREDWQPVRLTFAPSGDGWLAEPVFGKSNLIFSLANADGMLRIHPDANGLAAGEWVDVYPID